MSVRTDVINLSVNVNGNVAQNQLNELRKKAADVKFEMEGLKKGTQEYINKKAELKLITDQMADLKKTIGLTALSQKELTQELTKLKALRGSVVPFSDEYKELDKSIKAVENRLYDVRNGVQGFSSALSKVKDEVKQFGVAAAAYLGFQFITSQFQNIINGAGKLSDQLADLRRVAGLTSQEAQKLNSSLAKIDTRTSVSGLRDIAVVAGKLGVAKDDILEFTKSVDELVVTLGDELGDADQVTTQLGKILNVFDGNINGDNIKKLGNAFVELANSGSATGAFIADFDQRLSGIAKSSGISLGALSGLGAGLEEMGAKVESSSTAIQKLIITIAQDIPAATKVANISVEDFAKLGVKSFDELFKKDPTEALLRYSQGLIKDKKSFSEVTASLKDAGEEGARTIETITKLGGSADYLRGRIDLGTKSIQENNAITDAFAIKNENFGATLDKLGKEFNSFVSSAAVTNFLKGAVEGIANFIKFLKDLPTFLSENRTAFIALTGIVLTYIAVKTKATQSVILNRLATLLETAADKLEAAQKAISTVATKAYAFAKGVLTGKINLATEAQKLFNLVLKANPIGLVIGLITAAATAFSYFSNAVKKNTDVQKNNVDILNDVNKSTSDVKSQIETLTKVIASSTATDEEKAKALTKIKDINHEYLDGLTQENITTQQGIDIIKKYITSIDQLADAKARVNLKSKLKEQLLESDNTLSGLEVEKASTPKISTAKKLVLGSDGKFFGLGDRNEYDVNEDIDKEQENRKKIDNRLKALDTDNDKEIESYRKKIQDKNKILAGLAKDSDQAKKLARDIATDQKTLFVLTGLDDSANPTAPDNASPSDKPLENSVAARKAFLEGKIKELQELYLKLNESDKKGQQINLSQQKKYQAELDALLGKDPKKSSSERKGESEYDRLKKEAEKFYADIQKLKQKAEAGDLADRDKEVQEVQDKYNDLTKRAAEFYKKRITSSSVYNEEISIIEKKTFQEIEALRKKFFDQDSEKEYEDSKNAYSEYFSGLRDVAARNYAEGKTTKNQYEKELKDIEYRELRQRISNAEDYAQTSKKAAGDLTKFKIDLNHQETKDLQQQQDLRLQLEEKNEEALQAIRDLQLKNASPQTRKDIEIRDAKTERNKKIQELKDALEKSGQAFDDESIKDQGAFKEAWATFNDKVKDANQQFWDTQINNVLNYVDAFQQGLSSLDSIISNHENKQLADEKKRNADKQTSLKKLLDTKLLSQRQYDNRVNDLNEESAKKERKVAHDQAEREKGLNLFSAIINTAAGIAKALSHLDFVSAGIVGVLGGLQIAAIASKDVPEAGQGALLSEGPYHKDKEKGLHVVDPRTGETKLLLEKDEMVIKGAATRDEKTYTVTGTPAQIGSKINSMHGGVSWAPGAVIQLPLFRTQKPAMINNNMPKIMEQGGVIRSLPGVTKRVQEGTNNPDSAEMILQLMHKQDQQNQALIEKHNETIAEFKNFKRDLHARVSIKEYRETESNYETAKNASGINKKTA